MEYHDSQHQLPPIQHRSYQFIGNSMVENFPVSSRLCIILNSSWRMDIAHQTFTTGQTVLTFNIIRRYINYNSCTRKYKVIRIFFELLLTSSDILFYVFPRIVFVAITQLKFVFFKNFTVDLTLCSNISSIFVAFLENMNFI